MSIHSFVTAIGPILAPSTEHMKDELRRYQRITELPESCLIIVRPSKDPEGRPVTMVATEWFGTIYDVAVVLHKLPNKIELEAYQNAKAAQSNIILPHVAMGAMPGMQHKP